MQKRLKQKSDFVSRELLDAKTRYSTEERPFLCLYFSCTKLKAYLLTVECIVICKDDMVKHMLSLPIFQGRVRKVELGSIRI
jgi:hypothetical protein